MSSSDTNRLLRETLRESCEYEAFRNEMFQSGLAELRKKRRGAASWMQWALAASILFGIGLGIWGVTRQTPEIATESSVDSFVTVPLEPLRVVHSTKDDLVLVETRKAEATVEMVTTEQVPLVQLNDDELLAAFGN